VVAAVDQELK
jgi:serine/threonine protein kinase